MNIEERLAALEARLQAAEDQLEIIRLLNTYGPAVDSGLGHPAAQLWVEDGTYDLDGVGSIAGRDRIAALYDCGGYQDLVEMGVAHLTATPHITVSGDRAEAVAYSFVILKRSNEWYCSRASANRWTLTRTPEGWRIVERHNRVLDGSEASQQILRRAVRR